MPPRKPTLLEQDIFPQVVIKCTRIINLRPFASLDAKTKAKVKHQLTAAVAEFQALAKWYEKFPTMVRIVQSPSSHTHTAQVIIVCRFTAGRQIGLKKKTIIYDKQWTALLSVIGSEVGGPTVPGETNAT